MALYKTSSSSSSRTQGPAGVTEFEILMASHKFLREEDEKPSTWNDKLAEKYYSNLYREFAVCDLKHYKSGNFALRWRTEEEVLDGSGETTCGNTRCKWHFTSRFANNQVNEHDGGKDIPILTTLELPFAYVEHGEPKSALVKVVLCEKCVKKLMWRRNKERGKEKEMGQFVESSSHSPGGGADEPLEGRKRPREESNDKDGEREKRRQRKRSKDETDKKTRGNIS